MNEAATALPMARPRRSLMVKDLAPGLPERGKIKIGMKGQMMKSKQGNDFQPPKKLDHFVVTTTTRGPDGNFVRDEALHKVLGDKPTAIPIYLPFHDIELNLQTSYACYQGRKMWCRGDGEFAQRMGENGSRLSVPCVCERIAADYTGKDKCKINGLLSVMIRDAGGVGGVWKFRTTSFNTVTGFMSTLALIKATTGGPLAGIPLVMKINPKTVASPTDGAVQTIYVVSLEYEGNMEALRQEGYQLALAQSKHNYSIQHIEDQVRKMIAPPDAPLPGDDPDDVWQEFYPEQGGPARIINRQTGEVRDVLPGMEGAEAERPGLDGTAIPPQAPDPESKAPNGKPPAAAEPPKEPAPIQPAPPQPRPQEPEPLPQAARTSAPPVVSDDDDFFG